MEVLFLQSSLSSSCVVSKNSAGYTPACITLADSVLGIVMLCAALLVVCCGMLCISYFSSPLSGDEEK